MLTDQDVIAAIRANHLQANIVEFERDPGLMGAPDWDHASVDIGGTVFGPGPYLHVPIVGGAGDGTRQRVYAPERLRKRLLQQWNVRPR